jgi:thiosulfate/3-mercaptopyruvate sulfurtransferase
LREELEEVGRTPLLLDLRPAEDFAAGHVPGAVHVDLWGVSLIDTSPAPLRAFLWMIHHVLEARGVTATRPVVVYDDKSGVRAARAYWFLEYFGHPNARVLDGGFTAWVSDGSPVTREAKRPEPASWTAREQPDRVATWQDVRSRLDDPGTVLLDTRTDAEYFGMIARARRAGAVPGAVHIEWVHNLDERGAFKPADELRDLYARAGITPDREVVAYCQGGYRAAHSYLALRLLGFPRVRNYIGSWKEWGDREDLPLELPRARR